MRKLFLACMLVALAGPVEARDLWTKQQANSWYAQQKWLVGSNYIPADAINQLEMWQEASFNPAQIDKELGWAKGMGMNTMRVYLHDLLWQQDAPGLKRRMGVFLDIAAKHGIKPLFVLFDSCWDPNPKLGVQRPPIPGVHNSGWVQSPGAKALADPSQYPGPLPKTIASWVGMCGTSPTIPAAATTMIVHRNGSPMSQSFCRRCLSGRALLTPYSL